MVDAWQISDWATYRDVRRLGRKTRLPEAQRATLWSIFEGLSDKLKQDGLTTEAGIFSRLTNDLPSRRNPIYDSVVVDEAQDINVPQLRFLSALGNDRPNALFFLISPNPQPPSRVI